MKVLIIGNIGSGKKAMAEQLIGRENIALLPLDELTNSCEQTGNTLEEGLNMLRNVLEDHTDWVVECANSDLAEVALPYCEELRYISQGVTGNPSNDNAGEEIYSSKRYRELFESFAGLKTEYNGDT
ncbi:hypothetical protein [Microbulbifer taiwanensis]|uniref:Shikimate kinase n=1 Tax=Microbulbifer taiwanensis TaxID=986746 RepID=A0ABW1YVB4_9GAMM|nr:hypothetical protein [Microbulbifer taiwanensis]